MSFSPAARVTFDLHDNDKKLIEYGKNKTMDVMRTAGATEVVQEARYAHLVGAARMGDDPASSLVDRFGRTHDIDNLFICDGSIMPTQGSANLGLTIMAESARIADYLVAQGASIFGSGERPMQGRSRHTATAAMAAANSGAVLLGPQRRAFVLGAIAEAPLCAGIAAGRLEQVTGAPRAIGFVSLLPAIDVRANFFLHLRQAKLPVSIKEYLMLLEAMRELVIGPSIDEFYWLSRASLVKDERNFDKFDRAFAVYFKGVQAVPGIDVDLPLEWLKRQLQREFTAEEKAAIEAMGGLDELLDRMRELLEEQKGRHEGGSKWIGTNGTSPFGNGGYNPEGIRIGGPSAGNRTAVEVWEQRAYPDYDDQVELGTRTSR